MYLPFVRVQVHLCPSMVNVVFLLAVFRANFVTHLQVAETDRLSYVASNFGPESLKCNTLCKYVLKLFSALNKSVLSFHDIAILFERLIVRCLKLFKVEKGVILLT